MANENLSKIVEILVKNQNDILNEWLKEQSAFLTFHPDQIHEAELKQQSSEFLTLFIQAVQSNSAYQISSPSWAKVREMLQSVSRSRAMQGFTPTETASFIFALKKPIFNRLQAIQANANISQDQWNLNVLIDNLGLYTTEVFLSSKESVIARQQKEMVELSTPVVQLWDGILALPLIGTLDSERTQVVMESLLTKIVETGSFIAIIDITGVPTVDTLVAQHLLKTVAAAKLMGADCIISGIRPQIAQTIVHLGVDLSAVITKASMAEAFKIALQKNGLTVLKIQPSAGPKNG